MSGRKARVRLQATEYVPSADVLPGLIGAGMTSTEATAALTRNSARMRNKLRIDEGDGPIIVNGEVVKVEKVAGVLRLAPGVELDVAPKFLGDQHPDWREDLLAISNYTQRGQLDPEHVRAQVGVAGDLASVIGRTFVSEFWANYRKPLRIYREQRWRDFSLDGDLDFDELHERSADGLPQRAVVLDRSNPYNALLARAAEVLVTDVRDAMLRQELLRVRALLGPQEAPPRSVRPVPARHQPWEPLVELSKRIIGEADLTLRSDRFEAPGFVVRTWEAWERLTFLALRQELGFSGVEAQREHDWGYREGGKAIKVKPDVTVAHGTPDVRLVDAKYKTRIDKANLRITQSDLMEAAAFMTACGTDRIVLLYPRSAASGAPGACGSAAIFDFATVMPGMEVIAVDVEVRGFSARGEHRRFAERLTQAVDNAFQLATPAVGTVLN